MPKKEGYGPSRKADVFSRDGSFTGKLRDMRRRIEGGDATGGRKIGTERGSGVKGR